jgi:WD40 repeat protein
MSEAIREKLLLTISSLATLNPASPSRAWQTVPHPSLPIVASASSDKTVRIYSLTSFTLLSTITGGHKRSIRSVAWKPNTKGESVLATGSFDSSAGIWRRWEIEGEGIRGRKGEGDEMDFTGGDQDDEEDEDEWRFSIVLEGHESEIKSVAWSAGGQYLATCSRDKSVWIWEEIEEDEFETVAVLQEHDGDVKTVVWHPQEDLLASASYDDTIRLYREDLDDWSCIAVLRGHGSTVWSLVFEPLSNVGRLQKDGLSEAQQTQLEARKKSGPRLLSASDDQSIRVWRRRPRETTEKPPDQSYPSILRNNSIEEDWYEESTLPQHHERAVYSLDWSKGSGRIVSSGSDGKIVVYEERWKEAPETADAPGSLTEWVEVAEFEGAHDVFEVNHVSWVKRRDKGRRSDSEEIIMSTGDDGEVKLWILDS